MSIPHEINAAFDINGQMIFRSECLCGLQSAWRDTPEEADADRPANCKAHDEHGQQITNCPACSVRWPGRAVADGAQLIAQHMARHIGGAA